MDNRGKYEDAAGINMGQQVAEPYPDATGMPQLPQLRRQSEVERMFNHLQPEARHLARLNMIAESGKLFALTVDAHTPPGADRDNAIALVRGAVQAAIAGIVTYT